MSAIRTGLAAAIVAACCLVGGAAAADSTVICVPVVDGGSNPPIPGTTLIIVPDGDRTFSRFDQTALVSSKMTVSQRAVLAVALQGLTMTYTGVTVTDTSKFGIQTNVDGSLTLVPAVTPKYFDKLNFKDQTKLPDATVWTYVPQSTPTGPKFNLQVYDFAKLQTFRDAAKVAK